MSHEDHPLIRRLNELRKRQDAEEGEPSMELAQEIAEAEYAIFETPELQPFVLAWMLDVEGRGTLDEERLAKIEENIQKYSPEELRQVISQSGGGLFTAVEAWFKERGACISDYAGDEDAWLIGVHCTSLQARQWYCELYDRFGKALKAKLLRVTLKPWAVTPMGGYEPLGEGDEWRGDTT